MIIYNIFPLVPAFQKCKNTLDAPIIIETAGLLPDLPRIRFVMLRLDLLPAQLSDSAAGPAHQPKQGGLPSDHEEVLLPWEIIARIVNTERVQFYQFINRLSNSMRT